MHRAARGAHVISKHLQLRHKSAAHTAAAHSQSLLHHCCSGTLATTLHTYLVCDPLQLPDCAVKLGFHFLFSPSEGKLPNSRSSTSRTLPDCVQPLALSTHMRHSSHQRSLQSQTVTSPLQPPKRPPAKPLSAHLTLFVTDCSS
jgi:hypothetical protein